MRKLLLWTGIAAGVGVIGYVIWKSRKGEPLLPGGATGAPSGSGYGPRWKRKPPGLPGVARQTSSPRSGLPVVREAASRQRLGPVFTRAVENLALTESGGQLGRPANNFDARCKPGHRVGRARLCTTVDGPRSPGKKIVTAWGIFQWNRDALRSLARNTRYIPALARHLHDKLPWELTQREEVDLPVKAYAHLWRAVKKAGGSDYDAARGVRLWHTSPGRFNRYIASGLNWGAQDHTVTARIDRHLRKAGIA